MVVDAIFSPSFGNRPSYLVGRETIIREFMHGLESEPGNRDRAMVLLGQRGSGKTVLLWELADRASASGFVAATPTVTSEGMLERIVEKIQEDGERYVKRRRTHLTGGTLGALGSSAGLEFSREVQETKSFQFKLAQLARKLTERGHGILILVDELQANSNEIRQLVIAYQELVGERLNITQDNIVSNKLKQIGGSLRALCCLKAQTRRDVNSQFAKCLVVKGIYIAYREGWKRYLPCAIKKRQHLVVKGC